MLVCVWTSPADGVLQSKEPKSQDGLIGRKESYKAAKPLSQWEVVGGARSRTFSTGMGVKSSKVKICRRASYCPLSSMFLRGGIKSLCMRTLFLLFSKR